MAHPVLDALKTIRGVHCMVKVGDLVAAESLATLSPNAKDQIVYRWAYAEHETGLNLPGQVAVQGNPVAKVGVESQKR